MKQRKIWTKVWKDEWFCNLSQGARLLFLYLITNESIGFTGCYELSDRQILFDTKLTNIEKLKAELSPKVKFANGWVYVVNSQGYNGFVGSSFEVAINKEKNGIPETIKTMLIKGEGYTTPPVPPPSRGDTSSKSSSNNSSNYKNIEDLLEKDLENISIKYQVPISFVKSRLDDMQNWISSKGGSPYKNHYSALCNWVKKDALKIKQDYAKQTNDIAL